MFLGYFQFIKKALKIATNILEIAGIQISKSQIKREIQSKVKQSFEIDARFANQVIVNRKCLKLF